MCRTNVGAGLLANAVYQAPYSVTDTAHSRASPLPQGFALRLKGFHAFRGAQQQYVSRTGREQTVGDDADDGIDLTLQFHRVGDLHVEHVDDDVAVVGQHAFAVHRVAAQLHQLAGHVAAGHRDHFHRQREGAEYRHQFAAIGDADEGLGHGRNDLLAGQGGAATLDQVQVFVAFVGAVDVELQVADGVQLIHRNAVALEAGGGGFGTGDRAIESALVLG